MDLEQAIRAKWHDQNPSWVRMLKSQGRFHDRLQEAKATASQVVGTSLERGLNPDQALELALDAVGIPPEPEPT